MPANETLLLAARVGVRQAGAVLAHVARPAAFCWMRCSRTQGVTRRRPRRCELPFFFAVVGARFARVTRLGVAAGGAAACGSAPHRRS